MGRIKEIFMQMYYANDGNIPGEVTVTDLVRMKELQIFEWKEYERQKEKIRNKEFQNSNPIETKKISETERQSGNHYKTTSNTDCE
jgi:hypothetical protein